MKVRRIAIPKFIFHLFFFLSSKKKKKKTFHLKNDRARERKLQGIQIVITSLSGWIWHVGDSV